MRINQAVASWLLGTLCYNSHARKVAFPVSSLSIIQLFSQEKYFLRRPLITATFIFAFLIGCAAASPLNRVLAQQPAPTTPSAAIKNPQKPEKVETQNPPKLDK